VASTFMSVETLRVPAVITSALREKQKCRFHAKAEVAVWINRRGPWDLRS
jgi:hypothetical protein